MTAASVFVNLASSAERHSPPGVDTRNPGAQVIDFVARELERAAQTPAHEVGVNPISVHAVIAMTGRSRRTWRRRIDEGLVRELSSDARGRARVALEDVLPAIECTFDAEDLALLLLADAGDLEAQADCGEMFLALRMREAARYWLELAAAQGHPNAMQCLARFHLSNEPTPKDEEIAMRWLTDAAAKGHVIAQAQMQSLRDESFSPFAPLQ